MMSCVDFFLKFNLSASGKSELFLIFLQKVDLKNNFHIKK